MQIEPLSRITGKITYWVGTCTWMPSSSFCPHLPSSVTFWPVKWDALYMSRLSHN